MKKRMGCDADLPTDAFDKYECRKLHATCRDCEKAAGDSKKAETRRCADCQNDLTKNASTRYSKGTYHAKCKRCERKKKKEGIERTKK